jgi:hypothetical protein
VDELEVGDVAEVLHRGEHPRLDVDRFACGVGHAERFEFGADGPSACLGIHSPIGADDP